MRLQTKLILSVLLGLVLVVMVVQLVQQVWTIRALHRLESENLKQEENSQWEHIDDLRSAIMSSLESAMNEGEMDRFRKILESQKQIRGIHEVALANFKGVVTYSTQKEKLRQTLPSELTAQLLSKPEAIRRRVGGSLEVYQPLPITTGCRECHGEFKQNSVGGVMVYRFSAEKVDDAREQWTRFVDTVSQSGIYGSVATILALVTLLGLLCLWLMRTQVVSPLEQIAGKLSSSSEDIGNTSTALAGASQRPGSGSLGTGFSDGAGQFLPRGDAKHDQANGGGRRVCPKDG
jgi:hypothetical protein